MKTKADPLQKLMEEAAQKVQALVDAAEAAWPGDYYRGCRDPVAVRIQYCPAVADEKAFKLWWLVEIDGGTDHWKDEWKFIGETLEEAAAKAIRDREIWLLISSPDLVHKLNATRPELVKALIEHLLEKRQED